MMRIVFTLLIIQAGILAGCSSIPKSPKIITKEVKVPVVKPCDISLPEQHIDFLTNLTKESTIDEIIKSLIAQIKYDDNYIKQLKTALNYCRTVSQERKDGTD